MRIRTVLYLMLASLFLLNACIEITEEITVKPDGSGSVCLTVDLGALGGAAGSDNSQFDLSVLERIRKIPAEAPRILGKVKGVNNVKAVNDDKKGIYSVGFDFTDSHVLNKAIYGLAGFKKGTFAPSFIKISKHKFVKKDISPFLRKAMKDQNKKSYNELFFSFISYKSTSHFPSDVKKISNIKSEQPDIRTVTTKFTLDEMLKGGFDFGNVIRY